MNEKENKKVNRRKFLEDSSKKALAGTAAAFLGLGMIKPKTTQAATCSGSCTGDCTTTCNVDCTTTCNVDCNGICKDDCQISCSSDCSGFCEGTCWASCRGENSPYGASTQVERGTHVSEREATNRHVTV